MGNIIEINRKYPFDPATINRYWSLVKHDPVSIRLDKIDIGKVIIRTMLRDDEEFIAGKIRLERIEEFKKENNLISLDSGVLNTFFDNESLISLIPDEWKGRTENDCTKFIIFDGTELKNSFESNLKNQKDEEANRIFLYLYWDEEYKKLRRDSFWVNQTVSRSHFSAFYRL